MSVNKVILIGNVGRDPEMKYFDNDVAKANFTLATSERGFTTSGGTQVPERTEWHNIVCWRGLAQIAEICQEGDYALRGGKNSFTVIRRPERSQKVCHRSGCRQSGAAEP